MSFEELEREVRQDLMMERWQRYRGGIIALALIVVSSVGGYQAWQYYQQQQTIQASEQYFQAEQALQNDLELGVSAMSQVISETVVGGYPILAQFRLAAEYAAKDEPESARRILLSLVERDDIKLYFNALARLQAAFLPIADPSTQTAEQMKHLLVPLLQDNNTWRHLARLAKVELLLKQNKKAEANELITLIKNDPATPSSLLQQANQLRAVL